MDWNDRPERSLDDDRARYQADMFIRYLAKRFGPDFVDRVWTTSLRRETPLEALDRLLPAGYILASPDPRIPDIVASGYFMENE